MLGNFLNQGKKKSLVPIPLILISPQPKQTKSKPFFLACHFLENRTSSLTTCSASIFALNLYPGPKLTLDETLKLFSGASRVSQSGLGSGWTPPPSFQSPNIWHRLRSRVKKRWACGGPDLSAGFRRLGGGQGGVENRPRPATCALPGPRGLGGPPPPPSQARQARGARRGGNPVTVQGGPGPPRPGGKLQPLGLGPAATPHFQPWARSPRLTRS